MGGYDDGRSWTDRRMKDVILNRSRLKLAAIRSEMMQMSRRPPRRCSYSLGRRVVSCTGESTDVQEWNEHMLSILDLNASVSSGIASERMTQASTKWPASFPAICGGSQCVPYRTSRSVPRQRDVLVIEEIPIYTASYRISIFRILDEQPSRGDMFLIPWR